MSTVVNPILPLTALLRPQMPGIYQRAMVYDPTWGDPSYAAYLGQKIVPAVSSVVQDSDGTPLWVTKIDPISFIPSYMALPLSRTNDNVVSMLDYGNTTLRLYTDTRAQPYPVTPDSKCVIIGKSPRFYTLTRYPGTSDETIISQYYDATGALVSSMIPMVSLDSSQSSWYLPRGHVSAILDHNEEVQVKVFSEDGNLVYNATLFAKQSAVVNEDVIYSPTIMGVSVSANQKLADGTFFLYEKQNFGSLGLTIHLVYDDGSSEIVPVDGIKCILYGDGDFISSFSGLKQNVMIKYFRSAGEKIHPAIADGTGSMIVTTVPVTVIPNDYGITNKILVVPSYNNTLARYIPRYWLYFADGRQNIDVTPFVTIKSGTLDTTSARFGVQQVYAIGLDMHDVDPAHYPVSTIYQQTVVVTFGPPLSLVKWTLKDATNAPNIMGQDTPSARRPVIRYDAALKQYFIPANIFTNKAAFLNSFYTQASPPYDPSVSLLPQTPTHFVIRNLITGNQLVSGPISVDSYSQAFNIIGDVNGTYNNAVLVVEFINKVSADVSNVLFAIGVDVTSGTYIL